MSLSSLPVEIFQNILDLVVTGSRFRDAAQLRLVNRYFDQETLAAWARTHLLDTFPVDSASGIDCSPNSGSLIDFLTRYFSLRPHPGITFATLLNDVVDFFVDQEPQGIREQLRFQYMKTLLGVTGAGAAIHCLHFIKTSPISQIDIQDTHFYIFVASIYLKKLDVFRRMIDGAGLDILSNYRASLWGTPLHAALAIGDLDTVRMLLNRGALQGRHHFAPNGLERSAVKDAILLNADIEMIRLLIDPAYGYTASEEGPHHFGDELREAVKQGRQDIGILLLSHLTVNDTGNRDHLAHTLRFACEKGMTELVECFLEHGYSPNDITPSYGSCIFTQAVWRGQEDLVRLLLSRGADPYGKPHPRSMRAVAWSGHVGIARALLDAGVKHDPSEWSDILQIAAQRPSSVGFIRLLLERHVLEFASDPKNEWYGILAEAMLLACQQGNIQCIRVLFDHGVPLDDIHLYEQVIELPVPIVAAMAFGQDTAVQALKQLGAQNRDPIESIWAEKWTNGEIPMDPVTQLRTCRMPNGIP
ncbi:ankyrin [Delitschia confertaspora ATCC 74209]|uniref:Ankyrin n=1 Tax=Delitschia confertaspora ATCC 74209 TaxID=1513339 RepID=A0A9P4JSL6_9PLEO|nr:ankyrin [Delitschia confertaspora ATCC 74209]